MAGILAFGGFIPANALAGKDSMKLMVLGNDDRIELVSLFDVGTMGALASLALLAPWRRRICRDPREDE